ncbi:SusC/RagA family TonB-linked outer membrane protein [Chitinophagaceae bacterium LB-8]|uniref:SusC/RagA family TonB-linked outer membrane protein n=1 Tax=Paraflavisolibacter caeni TaxID=2982496 RepID=A0A9X3BJA7_9BACT|nr:SusC/RagA family TonB-linked outer membrane protein [Paraflavisolibacter caeni]MCU7552562.1 SusC/RagA family TonB-linked outer membrane protein [Paraflavisolibacter caeni]
MKMIAVLLLSACLTAGATGYSQKVTLSEKNARLEKVFNEIKRQTGFEFLYTDEMMQHAGRISIELKDVDLPDALNACFKGQPLGYAIMEKTVVVKSKPITISRTEDAPLPPNEIEIKGVVKDEDGKPLVGASVMLKGSKIGTVTTTNGEFIITVPNNATALVVSYVGMENAEVNINGKLNLNITLHVAAGLFQDVVVVGYGTQKKQAVTGAVATAKLSTYERVPTTNVFESLKGAVPGLNISGTQKAGEVPSFSIRGTNSVNSTGSNPLVVVDGVIFAGNLADIAPGDIESFTVLKDASATAVYGSRSGNGVILIETKKGKVLGKPQFDVVLNSGISTQMKPLEVYDAQGYIKRLLDLRADRGVESDPNRIEFYLQPEELKNYKATADHTPTVTDPFSLFRQKGKLMNATISVSNRTEKTRYYMSANLTNQRGVILNDEFTRYTGRVNVETDLAKWLTVGVKTSYSYRNYPDDRIYSGLGDGNSIYNFSPYASVTNPDGTYAKFPQTSTSFVSPFWQLATTADNRQNSLNGIGTAVVKVPWVQGLSYTLNAGITQNWNESGSFYNLQTMSGSTKNGVANRGYSRSTSRLVDNILKYNRSFAGVHNVDLTLLNSYENANSERMAASGSGFDNLALGDYGIGAAAVQTSSSGGTESVGKGHMGRLTYTFNNKYALTGTYRRDGYSAFGKDNKWASFPGVGVNWNISKEKFMEDVKAVDNLALRVSYGSNGTRSIALYQTLASMGGGRYIFYPDNSYTYTQSISTMASPYLVWESIVGWNTGLDFSLLKNRITGSLDLYSKYTENLINPQTLPAIGGIGSSVVNVGKIGNKGIELGLTTVNIQKHDFTWTTDFAFTLNRNKVISIYGKDNNGDGKEDDDLSRGLYIGKDRNAIYDYKIIGMWQQADKDKGTIMKGFNPGTYNIEDVSGDGNITSDKDRQFLGTGRENFRWGLTNTVAYKNWSLMAFLNSIWGGHGYFLGGNTPYFDPYVADEAHNRPVYDYWTPTNTGAAFPRPDISSKNAAATATKYIDRSFIRLQKVALTYDMSSLISKYGIKSMRASLSADNLFTYAPYWIGLDPEVGAGISVNSIPSIRNYSLVLSFNF